MPAGEYRQKHKQEPRNILDGKLCNNSYGFKQLTIALKLSVSYVFHPLFSGWIFRLGIGCWFGISNLAFLKVPWSLSGLSLESARGERGLTPPHPNPQIFSNECKSLRPSLLIYSPFFGIFNETKLARLLLIATDSETECVALWT